MRKWIPLIEFEDFLEAKGNKLDAVYTLQHYAEGWGGKWEEKLDERPCTEDNPFVFLEDGLWHGRLWGMDIIAKNVTCISIQGQASTLLPLFTKSTIRTVFIGRAETILHDEFGGKWFWSARRSMRFANHLREEADEFRKKYLDSDDVRDKTEVYEDWRDRKPSRGTALGGPYISVHLRRQDFIYARQDEVPTLKRAAKQIAKLLKLYELEKVYIATDAPLEETKELQQELKSFRVFHYIPSQDVFNQWGDGGVAIIDQIICSHARYFIGSYESTFSFRIQEEREILGFPVDTTFNRLCGKKSKCEQPAKWKIVY
ncbi:GDP-fucose protein O-fucosyltransferase 2 [Halocaridina rubra]|uniref:GDP-fucose protein O-fucosyltransferase 2 n=1 Tax=Halocaridina rubra TaxID=373956 RepID=A0AAN8XLB3_HALRR